MVQPQEVADLGANLPLPFKADAAAAAKEFRRRNCVKDRAVAERFPVHAIRAIEQHLVRMWHTPAWAEIEAPGPAK